MYICNANQTHSLYLNLLRNISWMDGQTDGRDTVHCIWLSTKERDYLLMKYIGDLCLLSRRKALL